MDGKEPDIPVYKVCFYNLIIDRSRDRDRKILFL